MWAQYKKTFFYIQLFIITICLVLEVIGVPLRGLLVPFVVMELGGVFGARWAYRLKKSGGSGAVGPLRPRSR